MRPNLCCFMRQPYQVLQGVQVLLRLLLRTNAYPQVAPPACSVKQSGNRVPTLQGFPRNRSARSLIATENAGCQQAIDYMLAYGDQPGMDDPLPPQPTTAPFVAAPPAPVAATGPYVSAYPSYGQPQQYGSYTSAQPGAMPYPPIMASDAGPPQGMRLLSLPVRAAFHDLQYKAGYCCRCLMHCLLPVAVGLRSIWRLGPSSSSGVLWHVAAAHACQHANKPRGCTCRPHYVWRRRHCAA